MPSLIWLGSFPISTRNLSRRILVSFFLLPFILPFFHSYDVGTKGISSSDTELLRALHSPFFAFYCQRHPLIQYLFLSVIPLPFAQPKGKPSTVTRHQPLNLVLPHLQKAYGLSFLNIRITRSSSSFRSPDIFLMPLQMPRSGSKRLFSPKCSPVRKTAGEVLFLSLPGR